MDHLPHPEGSSPAKVLFLPHIPNYGIVGDHAVFPEEHSYQVGAIYKRSSREIASFAQSFLFFGLLSDVLKKNVDQSQLVNADRAEPTISMKKLIDVILSARTGENEERERIKQLLDKASNHLAILERIKGPTEKPLPKVLVSVGVLIHTLHFLILGPNVDPDVTPKPLAYGDNDEASTISAVWFISKMKRRGWCSAQACQVVSLFPYGTAYYLSRLSRYPRKANEHRCCKRICTAYNITKGQYRTAHTSNCDQSICENLKVPQMASNLISEGKIPLVYIERSKEDGSMSIKVKELQQNDRYVAISHVWSDGRGNEKENGLPQCQIRQLSEYVSGTPRASPITEITEISMLPRDFSALKPTKLFWMDTFCIPHNKVMKDRAINTIPAIYNRAAQVLVLDMEMEQSCGKDSQWPELAGKLALSAWSGRSWTFEESGFSTDCHVKVADGYFRPFSDFRTWDAEAYRLYQDIFDSHTPRSDHLRSQNFNRVMMKMVSQPMVNVINDMFFRSSLHSDFESVLDMREHQLSLAWNNLTARQTSVKLDKLTILVHTLDLNPIEILGGPSARSRKQKVHRNDLEAQLPVTGYDATDRAEGQEPVDGAPRPSEEQAVLMKRVLMSFKKLPLDLLFQDGPRFRANEDHNYRWLPSFPSKDRIQSRCFMSWTSDGMQLGGEDDESSRPHLYLIKLDEKIRSANTITINLRHGEQEKKLGPLGGSKWTINFLRDLEDLLDRGKYSQAAIILDHSVEEKIRYQHRAAFVLIANDYQVCSFQASQPLSGSVDHSHQREEHTRLECIYDCPVRIQRFADGIDSSDDHSDGSPQSDNVRPCYIACWQMTLKCGLSTRLSVIELY